MSIWPSPRYIDQPACAVRSPYCERRVYGLLPRYRISPGIFTELTIGLSVPMKATIYQLANQQGKRMSALLREWINEWLDLPVGAE